MTEFPVGSPLPGTLGSGRREALTVAQLLSRMSPGRAPTQTPVTASQVISVGSLLRREGRAPHAQDRPLQPRAARQAEQPGVWPARPTSGRRRATAVAGALVATGSVLGAALYNGAASNSSEAQAAADGLFPGLGLPTAAPANALPAGFLPANVSLTSPLPDALAPGGTDWARLAFPGALPGSTAAGTVTAASSSESLRTVVPAARSAASQSQSQQQQQTPGGGGPGGVVPSLPVVSPPDRAPAGNVLDPVLGDGGPALGDPSGAGSGPIRDVTETLRPAGNTVGGVLHPVSQVASPVGETVGGVVRPVGQTLAPVTNSLRPVTRPVADALEPVTSPVLGGLEPVTGPVLNGTRPLTGPVLDSLGPVTGLLDTSAKGRSNPGSGRHTLTSDTDPSNTVAGLTAKAGSTLGGLTGKNNTGRAKGTDATGLLSGVGSTGLLGSGTDSTPDTGTQSSTGTQSGTKSGTKSGTGTKSGDQTSTNSDTKTGTSGVGSALGGVGNALGGLTGTG